MYNNFSDPFLFLQIGLGYPDFFEETYTPHLDFTLRGIKLVEAEQGGSQDRRLPITPLLFQRIKGVLAPRSTDPRRKKAMGRMLPRSFWISSLVQNDCARNGCL